MLALTTGLTLLLGVVTVIDRGFAFQPALSPDGTKVAYALDEGGAQGVGIYVAAVGGGGGEGGAAGGAARAVRIGGTGPGAEGQRLAARSLLHQPWSPDGSLVLFLAPVAGGREIHLYVAAPDGSGGPRQVGPRGGLVESASFLGDGRILCTFREARGAERMQVLAVDPGAAEPAQQSQVLFEYAQGEVIVDAAPGPGGTWLGAVVLSGPRDERVRGVRAIQLKERREVEIAARRPANFLAWAPDGSRLYFVDAAASVLFEWLPGAKEASVVAPDVRVAIPVLHGTWLLVVDPQGALAALAVQTGDRIPLGSSFVPTSISALGDKVALVRRGPQGAAVVVAHVTKEALAAGDVGLPKEEAPPAPPPGE